MESIFLIANTIVVAIFSFFIIKLLFGDGPLGRILSVLFAIIGGIGYLILYSWMNYEYEGESMILPFAVILGPIGTFLILALLAYAFDGQKNKEDNVN